MHIAAQNGHKDCVEELADQGGDVNEAMIVRVKLVGAHACV